MDQFNRAHLLLAIPADTATAFFQQTAEAITVATGCRWGGIGLGRPESSELDIVALWDGDRLTDPVSFNSIGSPFALARTASLEDAHVLCSSQLQQQFAYCPLVSELGAESYRGQAFYGEEQQIVGQIFALDERPQEDRTEIRFFFNLLSQRISAEYRRFNQQALLLRHTNMVSITRNMMSFVDMDYTYQAVSQGYVDTFGKPHQELIGQRVEDIHGKALFEKVIKPLLDGGFQGESINTRQWIYPPHKPPKYVDVWQTPYREKDGSICGVVVSGHDITEQRQIEETLQKLSLAVTHSPVLTIITNPTGVIEYVSPIVEKITGYKPEEVIGNTPRLFKSGRTDQKTYQALWQAIKNKQPWQGELENRRKDGIYYWESISIAPVLNETDELVAFVGISMDISERKQMERQLKELASTDPLTGIFNRRHFLEEMELQLAHSRRYATPLSVMIIDIDNFKKLNDSGGHALGDEAILWFTEVCGQTIRAVDILGRLGGDEFAIAMPETNATEAQVLAERLKESLSEKNIVCDQRIAQMTISIGLSTFLADHHRSDSVESLMSRADQALYQAKRGGRDLIRVS